MKVLNKTLFKAALKRDCQTANILIQKLQVFNSVLEGFCQKTGTLLLHVYLSFDIFTNQNRSMKFSIKYYYDAVKVLCMLSYRFYPSF